MTRSLTFLVLILLFNSTRGLCDFALQVNGVTVKKLIVTNGNVLATDGKSLVLTNEQGDRLLTTQLNIDNTYLLQEAVYNGGSYFLLYQHTGLIADFSLIALDQNLNAVWQKSFSHQGATFGYAMTAKHGGGVVVAGKSCNSGFFLFAVNADGTEAWKKLYMQGNTSVIPGAIVKNEFGYCVAFRFHHNDAYSLGMMDCNMLGNVSETTTADFSNNFYINGMTKSAASFDVLLCSPTASINSILTFSNDLQLTKRSDITAATALQLTGIERLNDDLFVVGNVLQPNSTDLEFIYARVNTITNELDAFTAGNYLAYDDAHCVAIHDNRIWIGGVIGENGQVLNLSSSGNSLCNYQPAELSIQQVSHSFNSFTLSSSSMTNVDILQTSVNTSVVPIAVGITCANVSTSADEITKTFAKESVAFDLYPNPATGRVTVDVTNEDYNDLVIYSTAGQRVYHQSVLKGINEINVSHLPAAAYTIVLKNAENHHATRRLILLPE